MKFFPISISSVVISFLLTTEALFALDIKNLVAAGNGCKTKQNISASLTDTGIEINFPDLKTDRAKGKKILRSNCSISMNLPNNQGKQFIPTAIKTNYRTTTTLNDQLNLNFKLWFQGENNTIVVDHKVETSKASEIRESIFIPIKTDTLSPCKKSNILNIGVSLIGKNSEKFSSEFNLEQTSNLKIEGIWLACN